MPEGELEDKATAANDRRGGHTSDAFYPAVGETKSWSVVHNGIEYSGEIIVADSWQPELGRKIRGEEAHFRIVFLTKPQDFSPESIADPRIAVCMPKKPVQEETAGRHRAVRESVAVYETAANGLEPSRYGEGHIYTRKSLPISAREVFSQADSSKQIDLIVSALLADIYPDLVMEPSWNAVLPYARLLGVELEGSPDTQQITEQERTLAGKLEVLGRNIEHVKGGLERLSTALGTPPVRGMTETLERLSRLAQARDHAHFHSIALEEDMTPDSLAQDLSLYQRLQQLVELSAEVMAARTYIDGAVLRESDQELAMDRMSIQGQISLQNLLPNPSLWSRVRALFDWFKSRYRILYQAHHRHYHQEMASLRLVLEESELEVDALRRLNSIPELGESLGEESLDEYHRLLAKVKPCSAVDVEKDALDTLPECPSCGLLLTSEPPTGEVDQFLNQLRQALQEQFRRLSSEAIHQILAQSGEERIDQFIKVIQTSDLSSLVNVVDDELVNFLRYLLSESELAPE